MLEHLGARQLSKEKRYESLCYRASGAQIILREVGTHHLRGPSGPTLQMALRKGKRGERGRVRGKRKMRVGAV